MWDFNVKTGKAWWSDMFYEKYGHPRDRPPTFEAWAAHIHPDDRERVTTSFVRVLTGGDQQWREDYRFRRADGTYASVVDRAYVGRDAFRDGLRLYMKTHAYSNTETTDLWDAIETASGEPARSIMDSWIYQGGYPLVSASVDATSAILATANL